MRDDKSGRFVASVSELEDSGAEYETGVPVENLEQAATEPATPAESPIDTTAPATELDGAAETTEPAEASVAPTPAPVASEFDAAAFAQEYGESDPELFKNCKSEADALKIVARSHAHLKRVYGQHTKEVGESRRRVAELETQLANLNKNTTADSAAPPVDVAAMSEEERLTLLERWETEPDAVLRDLRKTLRDELAAEFKSREEQRQKEIAQKNEEKEAQTEFAAFEKAHPKWRERQAVMVEICDSLRAVPPYEQVYALSWLKLQSPDIYSRVAEKLQAGYEYADAIRLHVDDPGILDVFGIKPAKRTASTSTAARQVAGPRGSARSAASMVTTSGARNISDDPDAGAPY